MRTHFRTRDNTFSQEEDEVLTFYEQVKCIYLFPLNLSVPSADISIDAVGSDVSSKYSMCQYSDQVRQPKPCQGFYYCIYEKPLYNARLVF